MDDAARFVDGAIAVLWLALAVAILVFVVAGLSKIIGPVVAWAEPRLLPRIARWSRERRGLPPDAPRWACRACHSVNEATAGSCYRCGSPAADAAEPLPEPSGDELAAPRAPQSRFDPSLYRGPGAPPPDPAAPPPPADDAAAPPPPADDAAAPDRAARFSTDDAAAPAPLPPGAPT
jgi:hypothetical protein